MGTVFIRQNLTYKDGPHNEKVKTTFPAKERRWLNVGLMLGQLRRRWANINITLGQRLVFAGLIQRLMFAELQLDFTHQMDHTIQIIGLKLHNCFAYFNQKINPWGMVFYFFILLLRLLSY